MAVGLSNQHIPNEKCQKEVVFTTFHVEPYFQTVMTPRHPAGAVTTS